MRPRIQTLRHAALLAALALSVVPLRAQTLPDLEPLKPPLSVDLLWAGFDALDRATPLEVEVLTSGEMDGAVWRLIRFQVGVFKGAPSRVAAFYAFPKDAKKLPALLQIHGGGQSAALDVALAEARRGYAALSLNWGGNALHFGRIKSDYHGPQTDWGNLDATHPPQRNKTNHFAGPLTGDEFSLDAAESPRNSNWFLVMMAARRALSFLEAQPEVDPARIGVFGHSMGGKLTTDLAGIDPRIKAAVPSCGGAGDILESQSDVPGCVKTSPSAMVLACVSDNAYLPRIKCPILWLSPTNDFHAPISNMAWNWRALPEERVRFSISPHLNHRHTDEHAITQHLWFEQYLKGAFEMPRTPRLELRPIAGVSEVLVSPDTSLPIRRVDIYYSSDPQELTRFWRDAGAVQTTGGQWRANCPRMKAGEPLFAYADVIYELPEPYRKIAQAPGQGNTEVFALSSRVLAVAAADLNGATDLPEAMIDDGSRGWHDWYLLNWGHPPLWRAFTRKLKDAKWRGPDGARLVFEIRSESDNALVIEMETNGWGALSPGKPAVRYTALKEVRDSQDWQSVSVALEDLLPLDLTQSAPLANWRSVTELSFGPSGEIRRDGAKVRIEGRAWQGAREIRNLQWE